jgi:hypothetical protein
MDSARTTSRERILKTLFQPEGVQFTHAEGWQQLAEHIDVHKYFLGQQLGMHVSWDEAVYSWYENVLRPLKQEIERWEVKSAFPDQAIGDLYLAISEHWHYLKERENGVTAQDAAQSFLRHYGKGLTAWFSRFLTRANTARTSENSDSQ